MRERQPSNPAREKAQALAVLKAALNQALANGAFNLDDTRQIIAAFDVMDKTVAEYLNSAAMAAKVAAGFAVENPVTETAQPEGKQIFMNPDNIQ